MNPLKRDPLKPNIFEHLGAWFVPIWGRVGWVQGHFGRALAKYLRFNFYPVLLLLGLGWLLYDWSGFTLHGQGPRNLSGVEDAIFDTVVAWRPHEPTSSNRVVIVEVDDCSTNWFRSKGLPSWPWPRDRHADLLSELGVRGAAAVGYDMLFLDAQVGKTESESDDMLVQVANSGAPFFFGISEDPVVGVTIPIGKWPGAVPLVAHPKVSPTVTIVPPFDRSLDARSGLLNISRSGDAVLRDITVWEPYGDWALPSLPVRLVSAVTHRSVTSYPQSIRINWRKKSRIERVSAVDLLPDSGMPCLAKGEKLPDFKGKLVFVGYNAAGLTDTKPTPIDSSMPGVEVLAEAAENLLSSSYIRTPPDSVKYLLTALVITLTSLSFYRGEPAKEIDAVFNITQIGLMGLAILTLSFGTYFFDIFTSVGVAVTFVSLCRWYASIMKASATGSDDHVRKLGERGRLQVAFVVLRVFADPESSEGRKAARRAFWEVNEYRRRIRRVWYAHAKGKLIEVSPDLKTWLSDDFRDVMLLAWHARDRAALRRMVATDIGKMYADVLTAVERSSLTANDRLESTLTAALETVDLVGLNEAERRAALRSAIGNLLRSPPRDSLRILLHERLDAAFDPPPTDVKMSDGLQGESSS
jgi:CHASE2 domain-containing sensor protein